MRFLISCFLSCSFLRSSDIISKADKDKSSFCDFCGFSLFIAAVTNKSKRSSSIHTWWGLAHVMSHLFAQVYFPIGTIGEKKLVSIFLVIVHFTTESSRPKKSHIFFCYVAWKMFVVWLKDQILLLLLLTLYGAYKSRKRYAKETFFAIVSLASKTNNPISLSR